MPADSAQSPSVNIPSHHRPVRVICITSGKGGVGKTNITVNLALALSLQNQNVMLLDADLGLANVDVILGLHPLYNLSHVISQERTLEEIIIAGPNGIRIIPASSGIKHMAELGPEENAGLVNAFSELNDSLDIMLIDSAAGISDSVVTFCRAAHEVVVVVCDEPASITDAYAMIKLLSQDYDVDRFHILANRVMTAQEGRELFTKLVKVSDRFLDVTLDFFGSIPEDPQLRKAVQAQRAVVEAFPGSRSAEAFHRLATQVVSRWPMPRTASGYLQFFIERLINPDYAVEERTE
ncbi:MAG TPA: cobyrinic acid a,c-diamide synthase [Gammaproteobacteria bacterium]|nr:MinD/ParA family protein [Candidatus Competibacteraceae bacterium]MCP5133982.1 MinD/ParA family protein [Gammaproteobacteria bacterium]HCB14833.1 cobyrinic acid a,c-diamide synthase [Gammaproteobacteria bacterium]